MLENVAKASKILIRDKEEKIKRLEVKLKNKKNAELKSTQFITAKLLVANE
jgi:hypothetical protein